MKGKIRTYSWVLSRPVADKSTDCDNFSEYVKNQISKSKKILKFERLTMKPDCVIETVMECWSCGKSSPNRFRRNILTNFPDADVQQLRKELA